MAPGSSLAPSWIQSWRNSNVLDAAREPQSPLVRHLAERLSEDQARVGRQGIDATAPASRDRIRKSWSGKYPRRLSRNPPFPVGVP